MAEPHKIRVLYFDESLYTLAKFMDNCGSREIIEVIGAFRSFAGMAPLLAQDDCAFLRQLAPDVLLLRIERADESHYQWLPQLKRNCRVKLLGLLSPACVDDHALLAALDYHTDLPAADSLRGDDDVYTRLLYQLKTARLTLNTEKAGVRGKWVVLPLPPKTVPRRRISLIAIGASAGGTEAVSRLLAELPSDMPPILVVQHIPENFTQFFANNLSGRTALQVRVAHGGERLDSGVVYIAGDGKHLEVTKSANGDFYAKCTQRDKVSGHRPSVDVLFTSIADAAGSAAIGVILTGMGSDGAQGLLEMREAGAFTIGQDEASSVVYGMPMVAYTIGAVVRQLPLDAIAAELVAVSFGNRKVVTKDE